jgi:predicted CoA-binding protein
VNHAIQDFIESKRIAIVGVSRKGRKFGNTANKELKVRGYETFIVHPKAEEIHGETCYPNLASLEGKADAVLVSVKSSQADEVFRQAAAAGIRNVWLQQGATSPELLELGKELDLNLVHGKCILMYAPPVTSFHGWHRSIVKFFGKL